jgi:hypothetical protein
VTPEGHLTKQVTDWLKRLKSQGQPVWWMKVHGHGFQSAGVPDLILCLAGRLLGLELKAGRNKPTALQCEVMKRIEAAGGRACAVWTLEEAQREVWNVLGEG